MSSHGNMSLSLQLYGQNKASVSGHFEVFHHCLFMNFIKEQISTRLKSKKSSSSRTSTWSHVVQYRLDLLEHLFGKVCFWSVDLFRISHFISCRLRLFRQTQTSFILSLLSRVTTFLLHTFATFHLSAKMFFLRYFNIFWKPLFFNVHVNGKPSSEYWDTQTYSYTVFS